MLLMSADLSRHSLAAVSAESVWPLRAKVLLDGDENASRFAADSDKATLHLAISVSDEIVAVSTICREAFHDIGADRAWRLRGVAVEPAWQGHGFGKRLMNACIDHVRRNDGKVVWCTARESARGFYESLGFVASEQSLMIAARPDMAFYEMRLLLPAAGHIDADR